MVHELTSTLDECVKKIAITKVVTSHSRPWITQELSDQLKLLRQQRKRCRLRKSAANVAEYYRIQKATFELIEKAENEWLSECQRLTQLNESEKWKMINKLTNQSLSVGIHPIRKTCNGESVYLFTDKEICGELEKYHINKVQQDDGSCQTCPDDKAELMKDIVDEARLVSGSSLMNSNILDHEIKGTFGRGSDTAGPDGISAKLIDKADRDQIHMCLKLLWNTAWNQGTFPEAWKLENRTT